MDRKSIIVLVACFILLMSWPMLVNRLYPPKPLPPGATNAQPTTLSAPNPGATSPAAPPTLESPAPAATTAAQAIVDTNVLEELVEVTNANAHYTFTSYGGGLKLAELLTYPESISTRRDRAAQTNRVATLNAFTPAPTLAVLGGSAVQG